MNEKSQNNKEQFQRTGVKECKWHRAQCASGSGQGSPIQVCSPQAQRQGMCQLLETETLSTASLMLQQKLNTEAPEDIAVSHKAHESTCTHSSAAGFPDAKALKSGSQRAI